ncbi:hypothetical protein EVAR_101737_1 [Eumeta japonica]|uniref:Transposable element Tc3 transposase n=1 Tax=Eumeta variegata TaxID=151549 RepID=A0A4C1SMX7_EUMVA|nr:hypothetical protein EVAR_101737_1 [Eumeta japonica]
MKGEQLLNQSVMWRCWDEFFVPELQNFPGYNQRIWFRQDGVFHTRPTGLYREFVQFFRKLISRRGDINWPPRSPDLTPDGLFLWGYVKSKVYTNKPLPWNN